MKYNCFKFQKLGKLHKTSKCFFTLFNTFLMVFILSFLLIGINSQNIRFTISGRQCVFPAKYKGVEHNNCIVNEKGHEWCYFDKLGISWDYCARGDFRIDSSILIKNINNSEESITRKTKLEYCLFNLKSDNKIYASKCENLLLINKLNLQEIIDIKNYEFYWMNGSQIKTKEDQLCLHPVETPIIVNNKISYYGYVETKRCVVNDDLTLNNEQKWKIDESGRIINEFLRKCIVRNEVAEKSQFLNIKLRNKKLNLPKEFEIFNINLGDCIGNPKGYSGRENFIIEEYRPEILEMMVLNKLMEVYSSGRKDIDSFLDKSNGEFLKLINYNSKLIDHKRIIDDTESKLETAESYLDNLNIEKKFNLGENNIASISRQLNNFNLNGMTIKLLKDLKSENIEHTENFNDDYTFIVNSPNIRNSTIMNYNFLDLFNNIENKVEYEKKIANQFKLLNLHGYMVYNPLDNVTISDGNISVSNTHELKLKIESNSNFLVILNSKIIFLNTAEAKENRPDSNTNFNIPIFYSENLKLNFPSLNDIQILIKNKANLDFKISMINKNNIELSNLEFIPFLPGENLCLDKKYFINNIESIDCEKTFTSGKNKFYFCDAQCSKKKTDKFSNENKKSICKTAFDKNILTPKGGFLSFSYADSNPIKLDFNLLGIDEMITEVKLGYIEDFKKYTREASQLIYENYKLALNIQDSNPDDSFLFYKRNIITDKNEFILIDIKLVCDNTIQENHIGHKMSENSYIYNLLKKYNIQIKKEKIHDMINGFTIMLYKIKYDEFINLSKYLYFIEDLNLEILNIDRINLDKINSSSKYSDPEYNKYVCSINKKSILLNVKLNTNTNTNFKSNIPDFHADVSTTDEQILEYSNRFNLKEFIVRCIIFEGEVKMKDFKSNLICGNAIDKGIITKTGGIFRIIINNRDLKFENIKEIPCLGIINSVRTTNKQILNFKTYLNSKEINLVIQNFISTIYPMENIDNKKFSSFLETQSEVTPVQSNKFYSNDLLVKIEQGLNRITDKIIEGSKKIAEVNK
jgi:hypothetical protein